jgi:hypothetical protein
VVEKFVHDNVSGFCANKVAVQISSGLTYQPITLFISEFRPADENFLALSQIKTGIDGNLESVFTRQYAPPFALLPSAVSDLRKKCLEHVELIAKRPRCTGEFYHKHTSMISWDVFKAITQYHRSVNVGMTRPKIPETLLNDSVIGPSCWRRNSALCHALFHGTKSCFHGQICRRGNQQPYSPNKASI